jgi:hypothetical protein
MACMAYNIAEKRRWLDMLEVIFDELGEGLVRAD